MSRDSSPLGENSFQHNHIYIPLQICLVFLATISYEHKKFCNKTFYDFNAIMKMIIFATKIWSHAVQCMHTWYMYSIVTVNVGLLYVYTPHKWYVNAFLLSRHMTALCGDNLILGTVDPILIVVLSSVTGLCL